MNDHEDVLKDTELSILTACFLRRNKPNKTEEMYRRGLVEGIKIQKGLRQAYKEILDKDPERKI